MGIKLDDAVLESLVNNLFLMDGALNKAIGGPVTEDIVGHEVLSTEINNYVSTWELTRGLLLKRIAALRTLMSNSIEGFKDLDAKLAGQIIGGL